MRKFIKTFVCVFSLVVASFGLVACDKGDTPPEPVTLTLDMVSLEYVTATYDGTAKEPVVTVTINEETVDNDEYTITYSNNTNVGTASVVVAAKEDSQVIDGTVTANFTIAKGTAVAATYEELVSALANTNYEKVRLVDFVTIPTGDTLVVPANMELILEEKTIQNRGTINNQGTITALVNTRGQLLAAFETANNIKLTEHIGEVGRWDDIDINAYTHDYKFTLDLNGYNIASELNFRTWGYYEEEYKYFNHSIDVTIINTSTQVKSSIGRIGDTDDCYYGIMANGKEDLKISLDNVIVQGYYGGVYTNGTCNLGGSFTATNCEFRTSTNSDAVGAYIAANYDYKFTNCKFTGSTAYYTKSGNHELTNCTFGSSMEYTNPTYQGSGATPTGSAIVIDSCVGDYARELTVVITGGEITSRYGYGVEECSTAANGVEKVNYATVQISGVEYNYCPLGNHKANEVLKPQA